MKHGKRILSVTVKRMLDDSPDTSWLGEYASQPTSEFSIDRSHSEDCASTDHTRDDYTYTHDTESDDTTVACIYCDAKDGELKTTPCPEFDFADDCDCSGGDMTRNEYRYFNPSFNYVDKNGRALPENTADEVRKYVRQDYERMESLNRGDWCFIGIRAEADVQLGEPSGYTSKGPVFITQTITSGGLWGIESDSGRDSIESEEKNQLAELRSQLKALGFSSRAISAAFKSVERKEAA